MLSSNYGIFMNHSASPQISIRISYDLTAIANSSGSDASPFIGSLADLANPATILLFIPLLNYVLIPLLGNYMPSMRKRIAIGIVLIIFAAAMCLLIVNKKAGAGVNVLPIIPLSIAEVLLYVTGSIIIRIL